MRPFVEAGQQRSRSAIEADPEARRLGKFVAGFIGSPAMNFIPGRCTPEGFAAAGVMLPIPAGAGKAHAG